MSTRAARVLGVTALVAVVAVVAADLAVHISVLGSVAFRDRAGEQLLGLAFPVIGLATVLQRPRNPVGWLLVAIGLSSSALGLVAGLELAAEAAGRGSPLDGWLDDLLWGPSMALFIALPVLFPDARLTRRIDRWLLRLLAAAAAINTAGALVRIEPVLAVAFWMIVVAALTAVVRFVARARRATGVERQQFRWVAWAFVAVVVAIGILIAMAVLVPQAPEWAADLIVGTAIALIPAAIGVSVTRYRLWEIDRLVNRAMVYGAVTVVVAAAYLAAVVVLQLATRPVLGESDVAVAGGTLAAAAAFRPVRSRLQTVVDRRFSRSRYDAARTIEVFGQRLRSRVELDGLEEDLRSVVSATVRPSHVSVWSGRATP